MNTFVKRSFFLSFLSLLFVVGLIAQTANCPELVSQALLAVEESCSATGRNEACYGYDQVEASFLTSVAEDFFAAPADLAPVAEIQIIRTAPLNIETGTWGVALMNIQADVPNTIPGQNVTFILLGDVEVENAVAQEDVFVPSDGVEVEVTIAEGANVRSGPGTSFNVIGSLMDGQTVMADGLSEDGQWLRVAYRERPAWLSMTVIDDSNPTLRDLPTLTADLQTPMQAFYLRTGIGEPACEEAPPDSLLVQGPENIKISINVNGANIRLGSSGSLRVIGEGDEKFLEVSVYDGEFEVGDVTIRRGQRSVICLGEENSRGLDGENNDLVVSCEPSTPEPFERGEGCSLETLPTALLNYPLDVPCPDDTPVPTPAPTDNTGGDGETSGSSVTGVDCSAFSLIGPLGPVDAGAHTFSWTPVRFENQSYQYQLVFFNSNGVEVNQFFTTDTSYILNLGETSTGGAFFWQVRFYLLGPAGELNYVCATASSPSIVRTADADPLPVSEGVLSISLECTVNGGTLESQGTVRWSGLPSGETITVSLDASVIHSSNDDSGIFDFSIYAGGSVLNVTTSGGESRSDSCY